MDKIWLEELIKQCKVHGKRANSGYKKEAWAAALNLLNDARSPPFKLSQLKSRHDILKQMYGTHAAILRTSGMGWESVSCQIECEDKVWNDFIEGKPAAYRASVPLPCLDSSSPREDTAANIVPEELDIDYDNESSDEEKEEETLPQKRKKSPIGKPPQRRRVRNSMASMFLDEFKSSRETHAEERRILARAINPNTEREERVQLALTTMENEFQNLSENAIMAGIDILSNYNDAATFLNLGNVNLEKWFMFQIRKKIGIN
ncbi:hypothetical protein AC1031_005353 [Aphanomyces cochlioides]|nr:hypothetical protein AC1031_005353 [Aphanomyces cochlioides]